MAGLDEISVTAREGVDQETVDTVRSVGTRSYKARTRFPLCTLSHQRRRRVHLSLLPILLGSRFFSRANLGNRFHNPLSLCRIR